MTFIFSVIDFNHESQKTSKCGKNISDTLTYSCNCLCATLLFLPHFAIICDLLLNRPTATWNLCVFVNYMYILMVFINNNIILLLLAYNKNTKHINLGGIISLMDDMVARSCLGAKLLHFIPKYIFWIGLVASKVPYIHR